MAAPKKKKSGVESLTPNAISVMVKGEEVRVATTREENCIMNMVMASQMRAMIHKAMEDYKNDDVKLTPKEIRDLAGAARDIASFSAEIYAGAEPITNETKPTQVPEADINFDSLHNVPEVVGEPPEADAAGSKPPEGQDS